MSTAAIPALTVRGPRHPEPFHALVAGKLVVASLLFATLVVPAAGGFHSQALWLRCLVYPIGLMVLPVAWRIRGNGSYPFAADAYLLAAFAFDAAGSSLGLYGRVDNFDNFAHLVGTFALAGFAGTLLASRSADRVVTVLAAAGVAAMFATGIELAEWTAFTHPVATGYGAYRDTVGDLAMDVVGATLGALAVSRV